MVQWSKKKKTVAGCASGERDLINVHAYERKICGLPGHHANCLKGGHECYASESGCTGQRVLEVEKNRKQEIVSLQKKSCTEKPEIVNKADRCMIKIRCRQRHGAVPEDSLSKASLNA